MIADVLRRFLRRPERRIDPRAECFRSHFHERLGHPKRFQTIYRSDTEPMIDLEVHRAPWDRDVYALVTVGLSYYTRQRGEPVEIMLLVDDVPWDAEEAFSRIAGLLADEPAAFGIGEVFYGEKSFGEIATRYGKTAMVLTMPGRDDEGLFHVDCEDGPGHVLLLLPISAAETDLLAAEGLPELEGRMGSVDVSDLARESVA